MATMKVRNFVVISNITLSQTERNETEIYFSHTALTEWRPVTFSTNR
jgi:hypothetical protein